MVAFLFLNSRIIGMITNLPEQILENVQMDLQLYGDRLEALSRAVRDNNVSKYPIFVLHREPTIALGKPFIIAEEYGSQWSVNISILEELAQKNIISLERITNFKSIYKDPDQYACLFILSGDHDAGFAFAPITHHSQS